MFGQHDDANAQNDQSTTPMPDGGLGQDTGTQAHTPVDDTAGEYIDSAPAAMGAGTFAPVAPAAASAAGAVDNNGLLDIKQQALQQLTPLVGHLDQKPSEKFRTTMMMIQASDNQALIKTAYETAQQITDEKERAQALLDVVNEINYFTQNAAGGSNADAPVAA